MQNNSLPIRALQYITTYAYNTFYTNKIYSYKIHINLRINFIQGLKGGDRDMQINPLTVIHNGEAYGFNQKIRSTSVKEADLIS